MKTKLLFTLTLIIATSFAFGQSLVLTFEGETLEPNAEITVEGAATAEEIVSELAVTNTSEETIDVLCMRYEIDIVDSTSNTFCWGGLCYPPWTNLSGFHHTIEPDETVDDDFSGHYNPFGYEGVSTIAYTFFDMNHPDDTVRVTILYDGLMVGVEEMEKYNEAKVYPNPANDYVKLDLNVADVDSDVTFQLLNVQGTVVREIKSNSTVFTLNTSDLAEGVYMYRALISEKTIVTDKIIVSH